MVSISRNEYVLLCVVFMVLSGSSHVSSNKCSSDSMQGCTDQKRGYGICRYFADIADCYEELEKNCTNDIMIERLAEGMAVLRSRAEKCTGMRDYSCLHSVLNDCENKAPYFMRYQIQHTEEGKKNYCPQIKSKLPIAKACSKALNTTCVSTHVAKFIELSVKKLEDVEKLCDGYNN